MSKRKYLKPHEYWEWRTTIAEMQLAQERFAHAETKQKLFIASELNNKKREYDKSVNEYAKMKLRLEKNTGNSLNGKLIDDVTFEIKEIGGANGTS